MILNANMVNIKQLFEPEKLLGLSRTTETLGLKISNMQRLISTKRDV